MLCLWWRLSSWEEVPSTLEGATLLREGATLLSACGITGEKPSAFNAGLGAREPVAMPLYSGDSGRGRQKQCRRRDRPDWPRLLRPLGGALQGETALIGHGRCARLTGLLRQTSLPASVGENAVCRTAGVECEYRVDAAGSHVTPHRVSSRRRPRVGWCPLPEGGAAPDQKSARRGSAASPGGPDAVSSARRAPSRPPGG